MNELNKEKEEKEEEVRVLNEEVKERSNHVNDLNKNGSMNLNGLNEASVLNEEERGERLMKEMFSLRVGNEKEIMMNRKN